jgi:tRNA(Ile)-lysidine synthase
MLEDDFLGFINDNHLFKPADRILLAISGGLDSMVMAELFHRVNQPFAMAHVNFGLRGAESDTDASFVQNKAREYGVPFHMVRVNTASVAAELGISIQMAARDLRYNWFIQLLHDYGYNAIATAHHLNDVLETLLLNLTRGTGLAGLHGILVKQHRTNLDGTQSGLLVRPLLFATRDRLTAYLQERGLSFREDSSNKEDKYARNRIRHHVVPVLTELNSSLWQTLPRTVERLRAAERLVQTELDRSWESIVETKGDCVLMPADKLLAQSEVHFRLTEWLKPFGFSTGQVDQILQVITQETGQIFQSTTHRIIHERQGLLLEPLTESADYTITLMEWPEAVVAVADQFTLQFEQIQKVSDFSPPTDPVIACLDANRLTFPLTIRRWRQGDRFRPLGLNGNKLVSDLLNDLKLSRAEREQTAVLISGDEIAWVIGRRIAHAFRVTAETEQIYRISLSRFY